MRYPVAVRALAATLTLVLGAGVAAAQPAFPCRRRPLAVTGRVLQVESQWDAATTTIVTYVDIAVDRYIRGRGTADRLVLKQLGGRVGEHRPLHSRPGARSRSASGRCCCWR